MMSSRLVTKRLQSNCQAQRTPGQSTSGQPTTNSPPELPIFNLIRNQFGRITLNSARRWETFSCREISTREQLYFLHECLRQNVLPKSCSYRPPLNHPQAWELVRLHGRRMIRMMITDCHARMRKYNMIIREQRTFCEQAIGEEYSAELRAAIQRRTTANKNRKRTQLDSKLTKIQRIPTQSQDNGWVRNLSSRPLSETEQDVLAKGTNFNTSDAPITQFLAGFDGALRSAQLDEQTQHSIRQSIIPNIKRNNNKQLLSKKETAALKSLNEDEQIVILPADKGRVTVVLDKADYIEKARQLLNDTTTYRTLENDPTDALAKQINKQLKKLQDRREITRTERLQMQAADNTIAKFYGLPKIHKEGVPLRPIVSLPGSPTYKLSKELWKRLKPLIAGSAFSINNANDFLEKLRNIRINEDESMVSFDVTSLFTSIGHQLAEETVMQLLQSNEQSEQTLSSRSTWELLQLCLDTNFIFDGQFYKQLKGTPMGSPISGFIAEAVLQRLEQVVIPLCNPKLWIRYVDDTFVILKNTQIQEVFQLINNVFRDIKFTTEQEDNDKIAFLDVMVHKQPDGTLQTSVYRKNTHTDQMLNFNSNHPAEHKRSCVKTLFNRAKTHCSTNALRKAEEKHLFNMFQKNEYTRNFIRRCLNTRTRQPTEENGNNRGIVIPYIKNVSEVIARLFRPYGISIVHKLSRTIRSIFKNHKPLCSREDRTQIVYRVNCLNCTQHYVGQTGRKLRTRMKEHRQAIQRHDPHSIMSIHEDQEGHQFDLENVEIFDQGRSRQNREFLEAWYSTANSINQHMELDSTYFQLRRKQRRQASNSRNHHSNDGHHNMNN